MSELLQGIEALEERARVYQENTQKTIEVLHAFIVAYDSDNPGFTLPADRTAHTRPLKELLHCIAYRHELLQKKAK